MQADKEKGIKGKSKVISILSIASAGRGPQWVSSPPSYIYLLSTLQADINWIFMFFKKNVLNQLAIWFFLIFIWIFFYFLQIMDKPRMKNIHKQWVIVST